MQDYTGNGDAVGAVMGNKQVYTDMRPRIAVIGVGGAGGNAVNNMIAAGLSGAKFIVANTDAQALAASSAEHRIQLGLKLTDGLGAGSKPDIGLAAAEEAIEEIRTELSGAHMVFIAAGMGGGTGTGAASIVARVAKEYGILTVAVVTKPFQFEGSRRMRVAEVGIAELGQYVDTLLVIPNQNLFKVATDRTTFAEAFVLADQVLYSGIACIVDLIVKEGLINLDLADVRTVLSGMGTAMMGTGEATGEQRATVAAEEAIVNPLLDDVKLKGARSVLLSITGGRDLTLYGVHDAADRVREEVDPDANIIMGATIDEALGDRVRVSIVASGMGRVGQPPREETAGWFKRAPRAPAGPQPGGEDYRRRLTEAIDDLEESEEEAAEGWRAPGDVVIREGPPQLAGQPPPLRGHGESPPAHQAPNPRAGRPPQGGDQRDQRPRNGDARGEPPSVYQRQPERQADSPPPRTSLLKRLTGAARGRREGVIRAEPKLDRQRNDADHEHDDEKIDLPVFFGPRRR